MSETNAIFPNGDFNSNIDHGTLKCNENTPEIDIDQINEVLLHYKGKVEKLSTNHIFNNILIILLALLTIIMTIKLFIVYKLK